MGEISRAKDQVLDYLANSGEGLLDRLAAGEGDEGLDDALSALYALGERHGEAEAELRWMARTAALRQLARRATAFVDGAGADETYERFKEALEAWWELGDV